MAFQTSGLVQKRCYSIANALELRLFALTHQYIENNVETWSGVECCFHTQLKYLSFYSNMLELSKSVCWIRTQLKSDSTFEFLLKS